VRLITGVYSINLSLQCLIENVINIQTVRWSSWYDSSGWGVMCTVSTPKIWPDVHGLFILPTAYHIHLYLWGINFLVLLKGQFRGYIFSWVLFFVVMNRVHMVLLIPPDCTVRGYNKWDFITSVRRYGRLVTERKLKNFYPFAVSVTKDKEIVHILIAPSSHSKL